MVCDICGNNEATVHLTEIINNQMTKLHLCEGCAREKGADMEEHFGLADLLAGLSDLGGGATSGKEVKLKCSNCGMVYSDFKKIGRLGCGECYEAFRANLIPLFRRIHGSDRHVGKAPAKVAVRKKPPKVPAQKPAKRPTNLEILRAKLQRAVQLEEFEDAAKLRDKIRVLETKNAKKSNKVKT